MTWEEEKFSASQSLLEPATGLYSMVCVRFTQRHFMLPIELLGVVLIMQGACMQNATSIDGDSVQLNQYNGLVSVVVNVASHCGFTEENYLGEWRFQFCVVRRTLV